MNDNAENKPEIKIENMTSSLVKTEQQVQKLSSLVDNLLDASMIQSGKFKYQFLLHKVCSLNEN